MTEALTRVQVIRILDRAREDAEIPNLARLNLAEVDLGGLDMRGADLRSASLEGAILTGADLRGANLSGADMREAWITGADFRGAMLGRPGSELGPAITIEQLGEAPSLLAAALVWWAGPGDAGRGIAGLVMALPLEAQQAMRDALMVASDMRESVDGAIQFDGQARP